MLNTQACMIQNTIIYELNRLKNLFMVNEIENRISHICLLICVRMKEIHIKLHTENKETNIDSSGKMCIQIWMNVFAQQLLLVRFFCVCMYEWRIFAHLPSERNFSVAFVGQLMSIADWPVFHRNSHGICKRLNKNNKNYHSLLSLWNTKANEYLLSLLCLLSYRVI